MAWKAVKLPKAVPIGENEHVYMMSEYATLFRLWTIKHADTMSIQYSLSRIMTQSWKTIIAPKPMNIVSIITQTYVATAGTTFTSVIIDRRLSENNSISAIFFAQFLLHMSRTRRSVLPSAHGFIYCEYHGGR